MSFTTAEKRNVKHVITNPFSSYQTKGVEGSGFFNRTAKAGNNKAASIIGSLSLIFIGTGSYLQLDSDDSFKFKDKLKTKYTTESVQVEKNIEESESILGKIDLIRDALKLTITDLSKIMGVTRPTVYAWLKDSEPHVEAVRKIDNLLLLARSISDLKLYRPDIMMKRPIFSGLSVVDLLVKGEEPHADNLHLMQVIDRKEYQARNNIDLNKRKIRSYGEVLDGFGGTSIDDKGGV